MIRFFAIAALLLVFGSETQAQFRGRIGGGQPAGVIRPPSLPLAGSPLQHMTVAQPVYGVRPAYVGNPYINNLWAYPTYYPWYNTVPSTTVVNNYIVPPPIPEPEVFVPPPPPPELRARLSLNIPAGSKVWLGEQEVDAAVSPLVLESPVLQDGQKYAFDVKITWRDGKNTEERKRMVSVDAGDTKSLTYFR